MRQLSTAGSHTWRRPWRLPAPRPEGATTREASRRERALSFVNPIIVLRRPLSRSNCCSRSTVAVRERLASFEWRAEEAIEQDGELLLSPGNLKAEGSRALFLRPRSNSKLDNYEKFNLPYPRVTVQSFGQVQKRNFLRVAPHTSWILILRASRLRLARLATSLRR